MPSMLDLTPIRIDDVEPSTPIGRALLELNNADHLQLSWLEPERLSHLVRHAFVATRAGTAQALLLAFDQSADYDSPNFLWFRTRLNRFVYVDRVVVAADARGLGLARRLYGALFDAALHAGHDRIVCEVNSHPPNPGSDAFHASLGFTEMGTSILQGGKTVRYLVRTLPR